MIDALVAGGECRNFLQALGPGHRVTICQAIEKFSVFRAMRSLSGDGVSEFLQVLDPARRARFRQAHWKEARIPVNRQARWRGGCRNSLQLGLGRHQTINLSP